MRREVDHSPDNSDTNRRKRPVKKASRKPPKAKRPKRKRSVIHVVPDSMMGGWLVRAVKVFDEAGNRLEGFLSQPGQGLIGAYFAAYQCRTKAEAIHLARTEGLLHQPAQVVIHNAKGRIASDATIPKSSDPRKTRG